MIFAAHCGVADLEIAADDEYIHTIPAFLVAGLLDCSIDCIKGAVALNKLARCGRT